MKITWTCRKCRIAQLVLREVRLYPDGKGGDDPKWIYECPTPSCDQEAVAAGMSGSSAPRFAWLAPADGDDSELGGRVAGPAELAALGDILADSTSRDHDGRRVVWQ